MQTRLLSSVLVAASLSGQGCGNGTEHIPYKPPSPDPIKAFVESQPLPKPQPVHIIVKLNNGLTFFSVLYGNVHGSGAGLYYDGIAYGVENSEKLGWLRVNGPSKDSTLAMYDPVASDVALFAQETWDSLQSPTLEPGLESYVYWDGLMPVLARDSDVPEATLLRIADQLSGYIDPYVGELLLANPIAQNSRDILTVLANLPVFQGDAYAYVREKARELLNLLPPS